MTVLTVDKNLAEVEFEVNGIISMNDDHTKEEATMTLETWIKKTGPKEVARLCAVDPSTVSYWRTGKALPRPHHLIRITQVSNGLVTYKQMIEGFVRQSRGDK